MKFSMVGLNWTIYEGANRKINYAGLGEPFNFLAPQCYSKRLPSYLALAFNESGWSCRGLRPNG